LASNVQTKEGILPFGGVIARVSPIWWRIDGHCDGRKRKHCAREGDKNKIVPYRRPAQRICCG
jgi:hypothetical protein